MISLKKLNLNSSANAIETTESFQRRQRKLIVTPEEQPMSFGPVIEIQPVVWLRSSYWTASLHQIVQRLISPLRELKSALFPHSKEK